MSDLWHEGVWCQRCEEVHEGRFEDLARELDSQADLAKLAAMTAGYGAT